LLKKLETGVKRKLQKIKGKIYLKFL